MTLGQIAALTGLAILLGRLRKGRQFALLATSTAVIFWLQPRTPIASLAFWLPFGTLALTLLVWIVTSKPGERGWRKNGPSAAVVASVVILLALARWLEAPLTAWFTAPPPTWLILGFVGTATVIAIAALSSRTSSLLMGAVLCVIILIFLVVKSPALTNGVIQGLRSLRPLVGNGAEAQPLAWMGFSYIAFRLLHTIRDRQADRLPPVGLGEFVNYVIFFPAFAAGPIDRIERFVEELRKPLKLEEADWLEAGSRIILGLFKKLVIADLLAVVSISDPLVPYVKSPGWMWLFTYAYALRIFFDFSGYTDVAIGLGRLLGIKLPENFAAPYLKQNLALFWNSWHISLTQWFRSYVFNPMTRTLRSGPIVPPAWLAILLTQITTMVLIGLWHGVSWSFVVWGLWHGVGLFLHNRWVAVSRTFWQARAQSSTLGRAVRLAGTVLTFHYVAVGWLFFTLSTPALAVQSIRILIGSG